MDTDGSGSFRSPATLRQSPAGPSAQSALAAPGQAGLAPPQDPPPDAARRLLGWSAGAAISLATLMMIAASAGRPGRQVTRVRPPPGAPPWWLPARLPVALVTPGLWAAAIIGGCGVIAGLTAVSFGARPPVRPLLAAAFIASAAFTVLPPTGSTDSLDYAAYGRMVVLGHNPYVMTPDQLRRGHDPVGRAAPTDWDRYASAYGPLASAEQASAAELGGSSALFIVFWLKLWNALAFGAVVLILDRLLRRDPARRARAHLLWTVNPLLLWCLIEGGHADGLAAAAGFLGLVVLTVAPDTGRTTVPRALAAGLLVGAAIDIKATLAVFGLGVAWAVRKSVSTVPAAAAGALASWSRPICGSAMPRRPRCRRAVPTPAPTTSTSSSPGRSGTPPCRMSPGWPERSSWRWPDCCCGGCLRAIRPGPPSGPLWRSAWPGCWPGPTSSPGTTPWRSACSLSTLRPGSTG